LKAKHLPDLIIFSYRESYHWFSLRWMKSVPIVKRSKIFHFSLYLNFNHGQVLLCKNSSCFCLLFSYLKNLSRIFHSFWTSFRQKLLDNWWPTTENVEICKNWPWCTGFVINGVDKWYRNFWYLILVGLGKEEYFFPWNFLFQFLLTNGECSLCFFSVGRETAIVFACSS